MKELKVMPLLPSWK